VVIQVGYPVTDGALSDSSIQTVTINGVNDAPIDADELTTLTEDEVIAAPTLAHFKLDNALDPDGDDVDIQSLDSATVTAVINGQNVSADFSFDIVGLVGTLKHLGSDVATFTVDPETGSENITSLDDAFWNSLGADDSVEVEVDYTVTDGDSTDASTQTITVNGVDDDPMIGPD
jgi:hypothetical protein